MGNKKRTIGYKYRLGLFMVTCITSGLSTSLRRIVFGGRDLWEGDQEEGLLLIGKPDFFGGEKKEGGFSGSIDLMPGKEDQGVNNYLSERFPDVVLPAFRNVFTMVFRQTLLTSLTPYIKPMLMEMQCHFTDWYPEKAEIGTEGDLNPAHMIYFLLTDTASGLGLASSKLDDTSFRSAADTLYDEGFGLSFAYEDDSVEALLTYIEDHIDGKVFENLTTGLMELSLIRDDYEKSELVHFSGPKDIIQIVECRKPTPSELVNQVNVEIVDKDNNVIPITVQNLALVGVSDASSPNSLDVKYHGVKDFDLGQKLAYRDLLSAGRPLFFLEFEAGRKAYNLKITQPIRFTHPDNTDIQDMVFRVVNIRLEDNESSRIIVTAVQDVFFQPESSYTQQQGELFVEPSEEPANLATSDVYLSLAPYSILRNTLDAEVFDSILEGEEWALLLCDRVTANDTEVSYLVGTSESTLTDNDTSVDYPEVAILGGDVGKLTGSFSTPSFSDTEIEYPVFAVINNEWIVVNSFDGTNLDVTRGALDTQPQEHAEGSLVFFVSSDSFLDEEPRAEGQTYFYKLIAQNTRGSADASQAPTKILAFTPRVDRPYSPKNVKLNGSFEPGSILDEVVVTWNTRNRLATSSNEDWYSDSNSTEPDTTVTISYYNMDSGSPVLILTRSGLVTNTDTLTLSQEFAASGGLADTIRVELYTVATVGGLQSFSTYIYDVPRTILNPPASAEEGDLAEIITTQDLSLDLDEEV
jgi:hypothetical protein